MLPSVGSYIYVSASIRYLTANNSFIPWFHEDYMCTVIQEDHNPGNAEVYSNIINYDFYIIQLK